MAQNDGIYIKVQRADTLKSFVQNARGEFRAERGLTGKRGRRPIESEVMGALFDRLMSEDHPLHMSQGRLVRITQEWFERRGRTPPDRKTVRKYLRKYNLVPYPASTQKRARPVKEKVAAAPEIPPPDDEEYLKWY